MTFETISTLAAASRENSSTSEPSGSAENDIFVAALYTEDDVAVTSPSGWTNLFSIDHAGQNMRLTVDIIRRGGSAPDLTWLHSTCISALAISRFSGRITTGDPLDGTPTSSGTSGNSASMTAPSMTVGNADADLVYINVEWAWDNQTGPAGMTERADLTGLGVATQDAVSAGATGDKTATNGSAGEYIAVLLALQAEPAGGGISIPVVMHHLRQQGIS